MLRRNFLFSRFVSHRAKSEKIIEIDQVEIVKPNENRVQREKPTKEELKVKVNIKFAILALVVTCSSVWMGLHDGRI